MNFVLSLVLGVLVGAPVSQASGSRELKCVRDQIEDEVIAYTPLSGKCSKSPKDLSQLTDYNGGGLIGDMVGKGSVARGFNYQLSEEQVDSYGTGKICRYTGCRRLAVSDKGLPPSPVAKSWHLCLAFKGGTSLPHKKSPNCPFAIKVGSRFRELIVDIKGSGGADCCYETDAPIPP